MDIKIIEKKKNGRTLCRINGRTYNLPNGLLKILEVVKPACEMERPKLQDFLPKDTTTDIVNNMFLENNELYNYINALDYYIDYLESKSV